MCTTGRMYVLFIVGQNDPARFFHSHSELHNSTASITANPIVQSRYGIDEEETHAGAWWWRNDPRSRPRAEQTSNCTASWTVFCYDLAVLRGASEEKPESRRKQPTQWNGRSSLNLGHRQEPVLIHLLEVVQAQARAHRRSAQGT